MNLAVSKAEAIQGWMAPDELEWLAEAASIRRCIVEVGSWKGRSTKALAVATPGIVWAVDHWQGSDDPQDETSREALLKGSDAIFQDFVSNLAGELRGGKVVPVRADTRSAVKDLATLLPGGRVEMIFIDAEHQYEAVRRDIELYLPLLASGGLMCGHDHDGFWPGVVRAVDELFPDRRRGPGSLWFV